jgi:electron transfer flavoprotein alpha subunit
MSMTPPSNPTSPPNTPRPSRRSPQDVNARIVATVASFQGKDLMPRLAAKLEAGMVSDVSAVTAEGSDILFKRPIWSGKLIEVVKGTSDIICATIRATEFEPA